MLREIAVSAISTPKYIYGMIYIIFDHRVGIFSSFINAMLLTPLLPHGAAEVSFQSAPPTKGLFCRTLYDSGKIC